MPPGAIALTDADMDSTCAEQHPGTSADWKADSDPTLSYQIKCGDDVRKGLNLDAYCASRDPIQDKRFVAGTQYRSDNPLRFSADSNLQPWKHWYCIPISTTPSPDQVNWSGLVPF